MLHRVRLALKRPGREPLGGITEVNGTYTGGEEPGLSRGRAKGKKALVAIAVEVTEPNGYGRCWTRVIPDATGPILHAFITDNIAPSMTIVTDGCHHRPRILETTF